MENRGHRMQKDKDIDDGPHDFSFPFIFLPVSDCFHVPNIQTGTGTSRTEPLGGHEDYEQASGPSQKLRHHRHIIV